jgi:hypothetical protein
MLNMNHMLTSSQTFEVILTRKPTINEGQNVRRRVEYVKAHDKAEAKAIALAMPQNKAFRVSSLKEIK